MKRAAAFLIGLLVCSLALVDFASVNSPVGRQTNAPAGYNTSEVWRLAQTPYTQIRAAVESDGDDPVPTRNHFKHRRPNSHDQVVIGQEYVLGAGEVADGSVVVVRGHARIEGAVNGDVVLVGSDTNMSGTVNGDVVSIASSINFESGATVIGDFVSLLSTIQGERQATFNGGSVVFLAGLGAFTIYVVDRSRRAPFAQSEVSGQTAHLAQTAAPAAPAQAAGISPALETAGVAGVPITPATKSDRGHSQFWPRLGSNLIDLALLYAILESVHLTRLLIPAWVLYRFAMYVWRSTTLGGIVLNLQVQKLDGTTLAGDHSTALIRALASLLSLLPIGLGFIWLLFDPERSTWHDKISGTRVVQVRQTPQSSVAYKPQEPPAPPE